MEARHGDRVISFNPPHPKIKLEHLHSNMKLLDDALISEISQKLADEKEAVFSRKYLKKHYQIDSPYRIAKTNGEYHAIYKGYSQRSELGVGGFGKAKLIQNLKTSEWNAIKIFKKESIIVGYKVNELKKRLEPVKEMKPSNEIINKEYEFLRKLELAKSIRLKKIDKKGKSSVKDYVLMKLIPGETINRLVTKDIGRHLSIFQWLKIAIQMAEALKALHKMNIVHGDFFIRNMHFHFLKQTFYILDFGMAENKNESKDNGQKDVMTLKAIITNIILRNLVDWKVTNPFPEIEAKFNQFDEWKEEPYPSPDQLLDLLIAKLKKIESSIPEQRVIKVMVLSIDEYQKAKQKEKKVEEEDDEEEEEEEEQEEEQEETRFGQLLKILKKYDEVILVDTKGEAKNDHFIQEIYKINADLTKPRERTFIRISNNVLIQPDAALLRELFEPLAKKEQARVIVSQLRYEQNEFRDSVIYQCHAQPSNIGSMNFFPEASNETRTSPAHPTQTVAQETATQSEVKMKKTS